MPVSVDAVGAPEAAQRAGQFLVAAERAAVHATRREQLNMAVLRAWVADDLPLALRLCDQVSDEFPRDLPSPDTSVFRIQPRQLARHAAGRPQGKNRRR